LSFEIFPHFIHCISSFSILPENLQNIQRRHWKENKSWGIKEYYVMYWQGSCCPLCQITLLLGWIKIPRWWKKNWYNVWNVGRKPTHTTLCLILIQKLRKEGLKGNVLCAIVKNLCLFKRRCLFSLFQLVHTTLWSTTKLTNNVQ
jgi:hypothetical protein